MKFFQSDCGHLVGCDDPSFDVEAEKLRRRHLAFYTDMTTAITTGQLGYRSGNPLDSDMQDICNVVAGDPSPENIRDAHRAFQICEENERRSNGEELALDKVWPYKSVCLRINGEQLRVFRDVLAKLADTREIRLVAGSDGLVIGADGWVSEPIGEYVE